MDTSLQDVGYLPAPVPRNGNGHNNSPKHTQYRLALQRQQLMREQDAAAKKAIE